MKQLKSDILIPKERFKIINSTVTDLGTNKVCPSVMIVNRSLLNFRQKEAFAWGCQITICLTELLENGLPTKESEAKVNNFQCLIDGKIKESVESPNALFVVKEIQNGICKLHYQVRDAKSTKRILKKLINQNPVDLEWDYEICYDEEWADTEWVWDYFKLPWHTVVKYRPEFYNEQGHYTKDEWTSICDMDKEYDGHKFTLKEYIEVESNYVKFIRELMEYSEMEFVSVRRFNLYESISKRIAKDKRFCEINEPLKDLDKTLKKGLRIHRTKIGNYIRACLRELAEISFENRGKGFEFDFGYDYYMHIRSSLPVERLNQIARQNDLFLDPRYGKVGLTENAPI